MRWPYDVELEFSAQTGRLVVSVEGPADDDFSCQILDLESLPPDQIISLLKALVDLRDAANRHAKHSGLIDAKVRVLWGSDKDKVA